MTATPTSKGPRSADEPGGGAPTPGPKSPGRRIRGLEPEERRRERRRQLMDSALELFATQGYAHTSIEQICQNAYVGFKGFYDEFATKEALFMALYQSRLQSVGENMVDAVRASPPSSLEVRRDLLEVFARSVLDDPRVARLLFVEAAGLSPTVEAFRRTMYRRFAEFLQYTYTSGRFSDATPPSGDRSVRRISLGVVGAIVEIMVDWLIDPDPDELDQLVDDLDRYCQVVIAGLSADG